MDTVILWTLLGFLLGSVPFSYFLGRLLLKTDIRRYGDGNPGGANAWRAGGWRIGLLAALLDVGKGFLPVLLARIYGVDGWNLLPVSLAPVLGHAFSPFLKFHGGKALGTTLGIWLSLVGVEVLLVFAVFTLSVLVLQMEHAWTGICGVVGLIIFLFAIQSPAYMIAIAVANLSIIVYKHKKELTQPIQLRPWVSNIIARR